MLKNPHFREKFVAEQTLISNALLAAESEMTPDFLTGLYISNQTAASVWHHAHLMGQKTQTRYGQVS